MSKTVVVKVAFAALFCGLLAKQVRCDPPSRPGLTVKFPGESFHGELPAFTEEERTLAKRLQTTVVKLSSEIGERNLEHPKQLAAAADWLQEQLKAAKYSVQQQVFPVDQTPCVNLEVEIQGQTRPSEIVIVGAHYDSVQGSPGANDNGSGTAACLELAKKFATTKLDRTLRFVFFTNEEPPYFQTETMGSWRYARRCKERKEDIVAILSLETMGYYTDAKDSQKYPPLLQPYYPSTGNFVGFVGNLESKSLLTQVITAFRRHTQFPSEGGSLPGTMTGVGWSDHWSFWQFGYRGVMVTDTAPFRYPHYHRQSDTADKLNYEALARITLGLEPVIRELVTSEAR